MDSVAPVPAPAFPAKPSSAHAHFVGAVTCQSSFCHGGASPLRCQYTIWSHNDAHARAYNVLVSDYGINIAKAAGIASPTTDARCVTCHAPLAMPGVSLASTASTLEGVTCESCHNSAAAWLRSHTRPDYTYADRVRAGLRDLRDAYVRADTCVKCHQVIAPGLVKAGHPTLIFELDGQDASEPRHWMEKDSWFGAKAWLVGQLVALRDVCAEWARGANTPGNEAQEDAIARQVSVLKGLVLSVPSVTPPESSMTPTGIGAWAAQAAETVSNQPWSEARTRETLAALAGLSDDFRESKAPLAEQAEFAQRLVLGLDRLLKATHPLPPSNPMKPSPPQPPMPGDAELAALFDEVQDSANFDAKKFADSLQKFAAVVAPAKN
ncbi:MAG TPA: multiheme c-type cytochrome [Candidatus Methylacidiphilales bacterium]|nr:multiheme c-type cytochrome [Candidatus Methylacidiphilales bacterium]